MNSKSQIAPFIQASLDDAGLSPAAFRVYCHIARRGDCWESVDAIAKFCGISRRKIREAMNELRARNAVTSEPRAGKTSIWRCNAPYQFTPLPKLVPTTSLGVGTKLVPPTSLDTTPPTSLDTPLPPLTIIEGNPTKVLPVKENTCTPSAGAAPAEQQMTIAGVSVNPIVQQIYDAYPRKVGRPAALRAIARAQANTPADVLLERTRQFAEAWRGASRDEMRFCPHPATWFNQQRYDDAPETWGRPSSNQKSSNTTLHEVIDVPSLL